MGSNALQVNHAYRRELRRLGLLKRISKSEKILLFALSDAAGADRCCEVSLAEIARKHPMHERTARRVRAQLVAKGFLQVDHHDGRESSYRLLIPDPSLFLPLAGRLTPGMVTGVEGGGGNRHGVTVCSFFEMERVADDHTSKQTQKGEA
jgi:hypothetical protein